MISVLRLVVSNKVKRDECIHHDDHGVQLKILSELEQQDVFSHQSTST